MDLTFVRRGIIQHLNLLSESWEERDLPRKEEEEKEGRKEEGMASQSLKPLTL
jgi:hypothetical protein